MTSDLEERFQELVSTKNVRGVIILNEDGAAIKTNLDPKETETYANIAHDIVSVSRKSFQEADPNNEPMFMRIR
jgi:predicted regulator of Ras-like GTPase activity (Roadblock/LC7/MglB family)